MARFLKSRLKTKGAAPGSLIFIGDKKMDDTRLNLLTYNENELFEKEYKSIDELLANIKSGYVNWINVDGIHDTDIIKKIGKEFNISPLALENIPDTGQRPKIFEDPGYAVLITKAVYFDRDENKISVEQISFVLRENIIISFQEKTGDHFEHVRNRIRNSVGKIRRTGSDYLAYALIDSLLDNYLINLEQIGSKIEALSSRLNDNNKEVSTLLFHYKTELSYFRRAIVPLKPLPVRLIKSDTKVISQENLVYFELLTDLSDQAHEAIDSYINMTNDLINMYNTNLSNRVNQVMKVLTIFASIFIPLTFIAGVYGTNFDYIPELQYRNAYFIMLGAMVLVAGVMIYFFKKHKWF